jgi:hypothetical protein
MALVCGTAVQSTSPTLGVQVRAVAVAFVPEFFSEEKMLSKKIIFAAACACDST